MTTAYKRTQKKAEKKWMSGMSEQPGKSSILKASPLSANALHNALNQEWQRIGAKLGNDPKSIDAVKLGLFSTKIKLLQIKLHALWVLHQLPCHLVIFGLQCHPTLFSPEV